MKKFILVISLIVIFGFNNINATSIYEPIGIGDNLEEYNLKKKNSTTVTNSANITNVNEYIFENNIQPAKVSLQYAKLSKITYQYRYMFYDTASYRPKGIVIHATAGGSNDKIENEIAYMSRNWKNAFVHSFADYKEIIETHNPEYAAWGAGVKANPYYIHIELVETGDTLRFVKSVNNQAYYAALKLKQFNLKPSRAKKDKSGSIWFHSEVTKYLGGTDHSDPVGYFKKHNYSLNDFYKLVVYHYNKLDDDYQIERNNLYHDNKKVKAAIEKTYYKNKLIENKTIYYNSNGIKIKQLQNIYTLKGVLKANKEYLYSIKSGTMVYNKSSKIVIYNEKGKKKTTTVNNKNKNGKVLEKKAYVYHSNLKVKQRIITKYQQVKTKCYKRKYEVVTWNNAGVKSGIYRYDYNSRGQLKSNKYGKARYVKYNYSKGKLKKRQIRYYNSYGKLNKKIYYKYY